MTRVRLRTVASVLSHISGARPFDSARAGSRAAYLLAILLGLSVGSARAGTLRGIPPYAPQVRVRGNIEVWGSPGDARLLNAWERGYRRVQPDVTFTNKMRGPDSTLAGLYTGLAQIAFMSRELWPVELMAYEWVYRFPPASVQVMTAALNNDRVSATPVVILNDHNPLSALSLKQLDDIFGSEHRRGGENIRTWGQAGADGTWAAKPVHAYGPAINSAPAYFFDQVVLKGSRMWNCDLKEFGSERNPDLARVAAAVAGDPDGIGYAVMSVLPRGVKVLALSGDGSNAQAGVSIPVFSRAASVRTRKYPLARPVSLYFTRKPGAPADRKVVDFLRYVLSREGQHAIVEDGAYEPLTTADDARQRGKLN